MKEFFQVHERLCGVRRAQHGVTIMSRRHSAAHAERSTERVIINHGCLQLLWRLEHVA
jgi:hypothetical protein